MKKIIITIAVISLVLLSPFITSGADKTKPFPARTGENKDIEQLFDGYCRQLVKMFPQNNILYTSFRKQVRELDIDKELKDQLSLEVREKIKTVVYPGYQALIGLLKRLKQKAPVDAGVWRLPLGAAFYQYCLRYHTGTSMTPEQIHKLGIKEVKRIQREIKRRLTRAGTETRPYTP